MSSMNSYVSLDPAARPVDRFLQADVAKPADTNPALQLAASLREFNPKLQGVLDRQFSAYRRASELQATKDVLSKRLDNMASFKKAVDDGEIPWADNPWSMAQAEQEVAKAEVRKIALGFDKKLEEDPARFQDNPDAVASLWDEHFAGFAQNLSPFAAEAVVPEMDSMKSRVLNQWSNQRSQERQVERQEKARDYLTSVLSSGSKFDSADKVAEVQTHLDEMLRTMHPTVANKLLYEAVEEAALQAKDANLVPRVLSQIKGKDGASLGSTSAAREIAFNSTTKVNSLILQQMKQESEATKQAAEAWSKSASDSLYAHAAAGESPLSHRLPKEMLENVPPGAFEDYFDKRYKLASAMHTADSQSSSDALKFLRSELEEYVKQTGDLPGARARFFADFRLLGAGKELTDRINELDREIGSAPNAMIRSNIMSEELDPRDPLSTEYVFYLAKNGAITEHEAAKWIDRAEQAEKFPTIEEAYRVAEQQLVAAYVQNDPAAAAFASFINSPGAPSASSETGARIVRAKAALSEKWFSYKMNSRGGKKILPEDAMSKLTEFVKQIQSEIPFNVKRSGSSSSDAPTLAPAKKSDQ
jgi:hypothetical protein